MADMALSVLGILNRSCSVTTASSPNPVPNLKVMMSLCFFLAVILRMYSRVWWCFTFPHPSLSDSSRSTVIELVVSKIWLIICILNITYDYLEREDTNQKEDTSRRILLERTLLERDTI